AGRRARNSGPHPRNLHRQGVHAGGFQSRAGHEARHEAQVHARASGAGHGGAGAVALPGRSAPSVRRAAGTRYPCAMTAQTERLLESGRRAIAAHPRSVPRAPSCWQTWDLIGRDHRQLGHAEVARLACQRALEEAPDEPEILAELGTLLWEMGQWNDAYVYLEHAVTVCPVDPGFALQLGLAEMQRGDLIAAHRLLTGAKHLDPSDRRIDVALQG